jgi:hypothetical protein
MSISFSMRRSSNRKSAGRANNNGFGIEFFLDWGMIEQTVDILLYHAIDIRTKELGAVVHIRNGNVGTNALLFAGDQIVFGTVFLVTCDLSWPEFPPEAGPPEQIEHRLIVHDFGWSNQDVQDDARFTSIHHIKGC